MGIGDVATRLPAIWRAVARIVRGVRRRRPAAALLVNFTELSARLGRWLRSQGVPVVWCVAPQIWAWRPGRAGTVGRAVDRLAVILPFEEPLWRGHGVDATFVGHPAVSPTLPCPTAGRDERAAAVLPGSRDGEVLRLAGPLGSAAGRMIARGSIARATVFRAPGLGARAREEIERAARSHRLEIVDADTERGAGASLHAFTLALCASGTASLEAALAGAAPVVAYRLDRIAWCLARRLVTTPHVALPNVLLGRRVYPELLQDEARPDRIAGAAEALLDGPVARGEAREHASTLRQMLLAPSGAPFGANVARLLRSVVSR